MKKWLLVLAATMILHGCIASMIDFQFGSSENGFYISVDRILQAVK